MYDLEGDGRYYDFSSHASIMALSESFKRAGYEVHMIGNLEGLLKELKNSVFDSDIIFNTVEGVASRNREGITPSFFEAFQIPYIGTDAYGLSTSLDKTRMKVIAQNLGIATPKYVTFNTHREIIFGQKTERDLNFPIIIKPNFEGNSSGIRVVNSHAEFEEYVEYVINQYGTEVLCEEFIRGMDLTVALVGTGKDAKVISVTAVGKQAISKNPEYWLTTNEKLYGDYRRVPVDISEDIQKLIENWSLLIYRSIGCRDYGRIDFRLGSDGIPYFIEINPIPGLSRFGAFGVTGDKEICYYDILSDIVKSAMKRYAML